MSALLRSTATLQSYGYRPISSRLYRQQPGGMVVVGTGVDNTFEYNIRWPRSRLNGIDGAMAAVDFKPRQRALVRAGGNATRVYAGITRDTNSAALGGMTVKLFRTATDEKIAEMVSDANGNYALVTPYADEHWIVTRKAGSPNVSGVSDYTITGA